MTGISQPAASSRTEADAVVGKLGQETGRPLRARSKGQGSSGWVFWFAVFWICVLVFKLTPAAGVAVFVTSFLEAMMGR